MAEFSVRSDSVDVEQIMRQIRARIREKRGADYTEAELEKLASVKLEKFIDPRGLRSDLVQQFRKRLGNEECDVTESVLYETHRPPLRRIRRLLNPILKLFINPAAIQPRAPQSDVLFYEVVHNLVVEVTRLGIEVHNMKMRVESMSSRLDFDERRARALEGSMQQRPQRRQDFQRSPMTSGSPASPTAPPGSGGQVSYGMPPDANPKPDAPINVTGAPPIFGGQGQPQGQGPQGPGRPDGQNGGDREGGRRRRRRRRRRPGQNMANQQGSIASPGSIGSAGSAGSAPRPHEQADGFDDGPDDGPDDEGAGNP